MKQHNFIIGPTDTDSISFCKQDNSPFSKEELKALLDELNGISPEMMIWEDDGYYKTVIAIRAKNYVLEKFDGTITYKGSGVKSTMKEVALREFIVRIIKEILDETNRFTEVYNEYVQEIMDIKDISRWSSKKTITPSVLNPKRSTEQKIKDTIAGTEYREGDKIRVFFMPDKTLCLQEKFNGVYDKHKMLEKLYNTAVLFDTILVTEDLFINYKLVKNYKLLGEKVMTIDQFKKMTQHELIELLKEIDVEVTVNSMGRLIKDVNSGETFFLPDPVENCSELTGCQKLDYAYAILASRVRKMKENRK
jgi:hypothetical protein